MQNITHSHLLSQVRSYLLWVRVWVWGWGWGGVTAGDFKLLMHQGERTVGGSHLL
jgi:hypothetical protein